MRRFVASDQRRGRAVIEKQQAAASTLLGGFATICEGYVVKYMYLMRVMGGSAQILSSSYRSVHASYRNTEEAEGSATWRRRVICSYGTEDDLRKIGERGSSNRLLRPQNLNSKLEEFLSN